MSPLCHLHGLNGQSCCAFVIDNLTKGRLVFFMNSSEFGFKHGMNQATVNLKMSSKGQSYIFPDYIGNIFLLLFLLKKHARGERRNRDDARARKASWFLPYNVLKSEANCVQFLIHMREIIKQNVCEVTQLYCSYAKYDQQFFHLLGLKVTK